MGAPGTKVTVKFARPGVADADRRHVHARDDPHPGRAVRDRRSDNKIGYIPLQQFNENAAAGSARTPFEAAPEAEGAQGHHPRYARQSRRHPRSEPRRSPICSSSRASRSRRSRARTVTTQPLRRARQRRSLPTMPLVVLTDECTASASRDRRRRAAGPRSRARRRADELRQGSRADASSTSTAATRSS